MAAATWLSFGQANGGSLLKNKNPCFALYTLSCVACNGGVQISPRSRTHFINPFMAPIPHIGAILIDSKTFVDRGLS